MDCFKSIIKYLLFILVFFSSHALYSQQVAPQTSETKKWHNKVEPYMMFPNMNGSTCVEALPLAEVDASVSNIFSYALCLYIKIQI